MSRFGKHQLHELYYYLKLTRSLEEELARLFRAGKLSGALPISTGQEALSLGATYPLRAQDVLASAVPCNTALLARGVTPFEILTHFMARRGSPSGGRDGSIQFCDLKRGLVAPTEHPAAHVAVMAGVAFAAKVQRKDWVALALVDERALATGDFHEGLNFASVHQLPLVVVIEKKPLDPAAAAYVAPAGQNHYERLKAYGLPTVMVDGNDVLQVLQVVEAALERARIGKGPSVIEARTAGRTRFSMREDILAVWPASAQRFPEAGADEPGEGQRKLAFEDRELNDPVDQFEAFLIEHAQMRPAEQKEILARVTKLIAEDVRRAEEEPPPASESPTTGVYDRGSNVPVRLAE
ncbi:MAG TPA: thiamine pyrophosphate-dependent enzyme [Vicinamibacteria bacterium]|nr:thiamine pyrophosphate-dependent enzyme [Vicinamibacteria bacterium]